jgi:hypothetical protein
MASTIFLIGHKNRLIEEIRSYVNAYFEDAGEQMPNDIGYYILDQSDMVLDGMVAEDGPAEDHVSVTDPASVEADYYRFAIAEYGTMFTDFPLDEDDEDLEEEEDNEEAEEAEEAENEEK